MGKIQEQIKITTVYKCNKANTSAMPYHLLKYSPSRSKRRKKKKSLSYEKIKFGGIKGHVNGPIAEKG